MKLARVGACIVFLIVGVHGCSSDSAPDDGGAACRVPWSGGSDLKVTRSDGSVEFSSSEEDGELGPGGGASTDSAQRFGVAYADFDSSPRRIAIVGPETGVRALSVGTDDKVEGEPVCDLAEVGPVFVLAGEFQGGIDVDVISRDGEAVAEFRDINHSGVTGIVGA